MAQTLDPRLHRDQNAAHTDAQNTSSWLEQLIDQGFDLRFVQRVKRRGELAQDDLVPALLHSAFLE